MKPQIVNIINFIRGVEPRDSEIDLKRPVEEQIRLLRQHELKGTFLLQYDALLREDIIELLKLQPDGYFEFGAWLEVMQPLVEDAEIEWKGRYSWDWHTDVGFSISYTPAERERIVDSLMKKFKEVFGYYPKSVGSWLIDAHTLSYMSEKYGIVASCNCKDQWGTDGYTLWGGYYNQAYYPSRLNAFTPAQTKEMQIDLPIFRMLGSDPIYQYDAGLNSSFNPSSDQNVVTLEPGCSQGSSEDWIEWYLKENFSGTCLSFGYTQAGQENSFGWGSMSKGLTLQFAIIARKVAEKKISVQTLAESGEWYRSHYAVTPASAIAAMSDWKNEGHKSVWYCSRFYRVNIFWEKDRFWIRDIYLFDEACEERYLHEKCTSPCCVYDNLPVMDGNRWSGNNIRAGIYPVSAGRHMRMEGGMPAVETIGDEELIVRWSVSGGGIFTVRCLPETLEIRLDDTPQDMPGWKLEFVTAEDTELPACKVTEKNTVFQSGGHSYILGAEKGSFHGDGKIRGLAIFPQNNLVVLQTSIVKNKII